MPKVKGDLGLTFLDRIEHAPSQGSGLGLAIAERVVRMHDGRISARNAVDGGLIVEMELPLA